MLVSGATNSPQPGAATLSQLQALQVNYSYSKTSQYQVTGNGGQQVASFGSAVNISLSVTALRVTTGVVAAEKLLSNTKPQPVNSTVDNSRAKNIETALKDFLRVLVENGALTGKAAKRLSALVSRLNTARGTHDAPDKNTHKELRSARQKVNNFLQQKESTALTDNNLKYFITLVSKVESLRNFVLKTADLLSALKGNGAQNSPRETESAAEPKNEIETETEDKAPSAQLNIKA